MANRILSDGLQLPDGNIYDIIPPSPSENNRGGISLDDKNKYDAYEARITVLETKIQQLENIINSQ